MKISRYLSPQVYKSIFSGQKDVAIHDRAQEPDDLFSDIKDFTATTERLQPEKITTLLNEYFTEMSEIALAHGGTIDKFIGDAILIFFGDPETKGEAEDARACVRMAFDMQKRLAELNIKWRHGGIEIPFGVRMGINTGYCNVGNFGSSIAWTTRSSAPRPISPRVCRRRASPGRSSSATRPTRWFATSSPHSALAPIHMKGISRAVTAYAVKGLMDGEGKTAEIFSAHMTGVDLYLDPSALGARLGEGISRDLAGRVGRARQAGASRRVDGSSSKACVMRPGARVARVCPNSRACCRSAKCEGARREMIYEQRLYRAMPGRLPNLLARFQNHTLDLWERHGIRQAGILDDPDRQIQSGPLLHAGLGIAQGART